MVRTSRTCDVTVDVRFARLVPVRTIRQVLILVKPVHRFPASSRRLTDGRRAATMSRAQGGSAAACVVMQAAPAVRSAPGRHEAPSPATGDGASGKERQRSANDGRFAVPAVQKLMVMEPGRRVPASAAPLAAAETVLLFNRGLR